MDESGQLDVIRRIFRFFDEGTTELAADPYVNDVARYTSPTRLAHERQLLFRREPLFLGLSSDVAEPGAWLAHADTDVPILVVRTRSGELAAFVNVCRHRGAPVASGFGVGTGRFTCPYHGWVYDEGGRVIAQPCPEGFAGLPASALCLPRLAVAEHHGMIFVRLSANDPIDIDAHLGGAERELRPLGLERYMRFARHETERALNWKLVIDGFLEAYHVPSLHQRTLSADILGTPAAWDPFGRGSRLVAVRRSIETLRHVPESEWSLPAHSVLLYQLFPNTMLIHQIDHVEVVQAYPGSGPDRAKIVYTVYTPGPVTTDGARRHFQANVDLLIRTVENEDLPLGEHIQRGYYAGENGTVVYGRNEPGLAHYHRMINARLAAVDDVADQRRLQTRTDD